MNRHGLSRNIPEEVKRAVRQRDGFGCVICGQALIEYEHFDPEYADAKSHDPSGIILLCTSCHAKKTRGRLSTETIKNAASNPRSKQIGYSYDAFDIGNQHPQITIGNITAKNCQSIIRIGDDEIISIRAPEINGAPFRLSAFLTDRNGQPQLTIEDNEWKSSTSNWDVNITGSRIFIRSAIRDIQLILRTNPPNEIIIERIHMTHKGVTVDCKEGRPTVFKFGDSVLETSAATIDGSLVAIDIAPEGSMKIGVGGGSVHIGQMVLNQTTPQKLSNNVIPFYRKP